MGRKWAGKVGKGPRAGLSCSLHVDAQRRRCQEGNRGDDSGRQGENGASEQGKGFLAEGTASSTEARRGSTPSVPKEEERAQRGRVGSARQSGPGDFRGVKDLKNFT